MNILKCNIFFQSCAFYKTGNSLFFIEYFRKFIFLSGNIENDLVSIFRIVFWSNILRPKIPLNQNSSGMFCNFLLCFGICIDLCEDILDLSVRERSFIRTSATRNSSTDSLLAYSRITFHYRGNFFLNYRS